ncbi:hypothetical protein ACFSL4_30730 [Streptomyces caeni]|uniref:Uncharacterized protein n=1 Tax=Streptomyces caeni TaxID=2307231 RepID=A0ABW4J024_9ACTN
MMGAGLVKAVYARWASLPHAPFRALVFMAVTAKDEDNPPCFWGGRESLALALGRMAPPPNDDDPEVIKERRAAFASVDRAVKELTKVKAIKVVEAAGHYRPAKYALNVLRDSTTLNVPVAPRSA